MPNDLLNLQEEAPPVEYVRIYKAFDRPQMTYFYRQKDSDGEAIEGGQVFACNEQEAGQFGKFHKFIGSSDGTTYVNTLREFCQKNKIGPNTRIPIARAQEAVKAAFDAELAVAIKNKKTKQARRPHYKNVFFDDTIRRHPQGKAIMDSFIPPA